MCRPVKRKIKEGEEKEEEEEEGEKKREEWRDMAVHSSIIPLQLVAAVKRNH